MMVLSIQFGFSLIRDRLEILYRLLSKDGSLLDHD